MKLVYLFAPPIEIGKEPSALLSTLPGIKVDEKTTFLLNLSTLNTAELPQKSFQGKGIRISSFPKIMDGVPEQINDLAVSSGEWSRFRIDSNIPGSAYEAMFKAWIKNSVNRSIADEVFVAKDSETGDIVGLITLKLKEGNITSIGLLAVSRTHRCL